MASFEFKMGRTSGSEFTRRRALVSWISTEAVMGMGRSLSLMFSCQVRRDRGERGQNMDLQNDGSALRDGLLFRNLSTRTDTQVLSSSPWRSLPRARSPAAKGSPPCMPADSACSGLAPEYTWAQNLGFETEPVTTAQTFFFPFQLQVYPESLG